MLQIRGVEGAAVVRFREKRKKKARNLLMIVSPFRQKEGGEYHCFFLLTVGGFAFFLFLFGDNGDV
jgi:hypothetical protein